MIIGLSKHCEHCCSLLHSRSNLQPQSHTEYSFCREPANTFPSKGIFEDLKVGLPHNSCIGIGSSVYRP